MRTPVAAMAAATRLARAASNGCRRSSVLATGSSIASGGTSLSDGCSAAESWISSAPSSRPKASQSSMARSGSASRTSRGVSSWSAAVRTPSFMNCGANSVIAIRRVRFAAPALHRGPDAALTGAVEDRLHDAVRAVAVLERRDGGRQRSIRRSVGDAAVDVAHQIAERIGPGFLMSAGQMRVRPPVFVDERRILLQHLVRALTVTPPQLVLVFLAPAHRGRRTAHLEDEIVLVTRAHLPDREHPFGAVVEPHEDRRQIFDGNVHDVHLVGAGDGKRLARSARLLSLRNAGRHVP